MQITSEALAAYFRVILPLLDERQRRLVAAAAVMMIGPGGQARVAEATGLSRNTLIGGAKELAGGAGPSDRVRRPGGGRKKATDMNPDLLAALDSLVEPESRGDPMSPLRWTLKSTRRRGPSAVPGTARPRSAWGGSTRARRDVRSHSSTEPVTGRRRGRW